MLPQGSKHGIDIIARTAPGCTVNIMAQYRPAHRADEYPELMGRPKTVAIEQLRCLATSKGLILAR